MSACPKRDFPLAPFSADPEPAPAVEVSRSPWWHGAIHLAALLGFLGLCALLCVAGLLWYSLALEPG